jgi:predicted tellurium resistance membrane protein TerC
MFDSIIPLLTDPAAWAALTALIVMEVVLGIDNLIFISILSNKLPPEHRQRVRRIGISLALVMRLVLLSMIAWIVSLTAPVFTVMDNAFSWKDMILIAGGLFLVWKSTMEIHQLLEGEEGSESKAVASSFGAVIVQIIIIDMVFSLDSIITAIGMVDRVEVMIAAVVASVGMMMLFAPAIGKLVSDHPTLKMLALSFLLVVGVVLIADGVETHVPKGYIYFAMAFSVMVEVLNIRLRKRTGDPVNLREPY